MAMSTAITLRLNGTTRDTDGERRARRRDVGRDLGAKGARVGCHTGDCGACSLLLDGLLVKSCLVLAVSVPGGEVTTIEGSAGTLVTCLKEAFVSQKGFQCGYCTPGMILTAADLLAKTPEPTEGEIRHAISGNLCRCTGYEAIVDAIAEAASKAARMKIAAPAEPSGQ